MRDLVIKIITKFSFKNISIKNRIVITYSFLILVFVATLSILSYTSSTKIIKDKSIKYTLGILEQIRNNVDINLEQIDLASYLIFSNPDILSTLKNIDGYKSGSNASKNFTVDKLMSDVVFSRRDIDSITIYNNDGARISTSIIFPEVSVEQIEKNAIEKDGRFAWLGYDDKMGVLTAVRQIRDMEMKPVGFLAMNIKESSVKKVCSEQVRNMNGQIYVVSGDGIILSGSNSSALGQKVDDSIMNKIEMHKVSNMVDKVRGQESIIAYYPSRINDWGYIGVIPMTEITKEAAVVRNMTIISSLVAIILFIIVSYRLAVGLTGPLKQIAGQMKKANITDWSPQLIYEGRNEIAYLTKEFNRMVLRINTLVGEVVEQKYRQSRQELKALQSQINPHFLYNTLEIVNWMARVKNVPEIADIVKALSDMMRYITSYKEEIVPIEKEIEYIQHYCLIQMARYKDKFDVIYSIEEELLDFDIPKLTLQPIIENAILHAFKGIKEKGRIRITGIITENKVRLQIIDNGKGMDQDTINKMLYEEGTSSDGSHTGIGVSNVNR